MQTENENAKNYIKFYRNEVYADTIANCIVRYTSLESISIAKYGFAVKQPFNSTISVDKKLNRT